MAEIKKFIIENFRGIERAEIELSGRVSTPIITLVGLNESGKTTILEALSHFVTGDAIVAKIFEGPKAATQTLSLIPIDKKANFTGTTKISAIITLTGEEIEEIEELAHDEFGLELEVDKIGVPISFSKQYNFVDGNLATKGTGNFTTLDLHTKKRKAKAFSKYERPQDGPDLFSQIWSRTLRYLPSVSYFPTFLVDLPSRIYLREHENETATNRHYRAVLQDVLDSLGDGLNLETHISQRIEDFRKTDQSPNWITSFWATPAKSQAASVVQKIQNAISREIIGSWNKIFHRPTSAKSVALDFNIDTAKGNLPYVTFYISDGESQYALHERSLGFRWFFSFLLFTRFKQAKNRTTIFLFDEPAANLHARAQSELLQSFDRITDGGHKVIYSTHSHHMIAPNWLSGAYIVENKAIDYDKDDDISIITSRRTEISAISYRQFVSQYPDRVSYYQPILEKLEYLNPKIIPNKPVVVTEGISDFYAFTVACRDTLASAKFEFVPGLGAGASGPLIAFLLAAGRKFVLLMDDDKAGKRECISYREKWFLSDDSVITLADLDPQFSGQKLETLLSDSTHKIICAHFSKLGDKASKKEIGAYFAEKSFANKTADALSKETRASLKRIVWELNQRF